MFGCSDVYHWMGRTAKAVCLPDCGRTCPWRTTWTQQLFGSAPQISGDPAQRHRQFCASSSLDRDLQDLPERVLAPQRWLDNIGPVLRRYRPPRMI